MKIDTPVPRISTTSIGAGQVNPAKRTEVSLVDKSASSNVQISSHLQALVNHSENIGTFDENKVMDINTAIAEGRFQVSTKAVTDGLIATTNDLIQSQSGTNWANPTKVRFNIA